jgi:DNA polymerase I
VQTVGGRRWRWEWDAAAWHAGADTEELDDGELMDADPAAWSWSMRDHGDPPGFRYTFALNHPVQGSAAEVTQIALAEVDRALRPYDARITATVHDEIVVECGEDHATVRAVVRLLRAKMTMAFLALFPGHPWRQVVEIKVGRSWGELAPFKAWLVR